MDIVKICQEVFESGARTETYFYNPMEGRVTKVIRHADRDERDIVELRPVEAAKYLTRELSRWMWAAWPKEADSDRAEFDGPESFATLSPLCTVVAGTSTDVYFDDVTNGGLWRMRSSPLMINGLPRYSPRWSWWDAHDAAIKREFLIS